MRINLRYVIGLVLALSPYHLVILSSAHACNVPVFRYALERWPADPYEVVIYHHGRLSAAEQALIDTLEKHAAGDSTRANLQVEVVDLHRRHEGLSQYFLALARDALPWMVVRYPATVRNDAVVWSGPLNAHTVQALVDSPARREIVTRIAAGETAVWVLLECGNQTKDAAAADVLARRLPELKKVLKLPELTDSPADKIATGGPPLRIAFSMIRIARSDPAERILAGMLLHSEEDLADVRDEPMVFPVFGRGRALWAVVGKGITEENIDDAGAFLVGPCSCQVKRLNPGTDLLMAANWDTLIEGRQVKEHELPQLRGLTFANITSEEVLTVAPRLSDSDTAAAAQSLPSGPAMSAVERTGEPDRLAPPSSRWALARNIGLAVLAAAVVLGAYALVLRGKNGRGNLP